MKSAPLVVFAEVVSAKLVSRARQVEKPHAVPGPMTPTIPLHLARISANVLLTLRGSESSNLEFYSWVWASGKHGGPRLFLPHPGSSHILFLRLEGDYLRTVGDYPAYDLEVPSPHVAEFISDWKSGREIENDLFERIAAVRIKEELESRVSIQRNYWSSDMHDFMGLTSPFFIASKLDSYCRQFPNPSGRFAACDATAREFGGRCEAYRLAEATVSDARDGGYLAKQLDYCRARTAAEIRQLRANNWLLTFNHGWQDTSERRRMTMRLYASAMDRQFHEAACEAAATMPEARDIPECR
ncbi:MAG: hypothetical protein ACRD7E_08565 [Bryobacteraceae bacterium]